jgi:hypothetical protein
MRVHIVHPRQGLTQSRSKKHPDVTITRRLGAAWCWYPVARKDDNIAGIHLSFGNETQYTYTVASASDVFLNWS